ncbi:MAG: ankyrin repeat domain-containing protein [Treponema sp.]|nr:ankyrin repeat domain-containing protein [Treponema sp.]
MKKSYHISVLCLAVLFSACATDPLVFRLLNKGKTQEAQALLTGKAALTDRDRRGRTVLHAAAETGNAEMVRFLLAMGSEVDALDNEGRTPLGIAAQLSDSESARLLTAAGADIHLPLGYSNSGTSALQGVRSGGALLEALIHPQTLNSRGPGGVTLIHLAGREGKAESARILVSAGALVNEKDDSGKTALDHAFAATDSAKYAETAERLVLAGCRSEDPFYPYFAPAARSANYNTLVADGYTALHYAAREGYTGYVSFFLDKKTDVDIKNNSGATALHEAVREGRVDTMSLLIIQGAKLDTQDAKGNSPLHLAAPEDKHREVAAMLLYNGASPNLRDEHGETPLHVVITLGRPRELIDLFLSRGADVTARNIEGKTALYLAVEHNRPGLIPSLLARRADVFAADNENITPLERAIIDKNDVVLDALLNDETIMQSDSSGNSLIHLAVKNKADMELLELILSRSGELNARNQEGNTPLHIANIVNYEAAGTMLISRGANIFAPNSKGENPLYLAFHSPGPIREWMLTQQTLEAKDGLENTALHYGAQWKLAAHVPLLVEKGSKLEAVNAMGETPLFLAARADSPETIRALLAAGASINARDSQGNSPLHSAVRWDAQNSIDPLIDAGISIDTQNLMGKAPLHEAVRLGLTVSETKLISRKANIEIRDVQGNTPFMEAVQNGSAGSMERLAYAGADPITRNNTGDTPLHIAVSIQRMDIVNMLLSYGAPIHARNSSGLTPFQIALSNSPEMTAALLTKDRVDMADDDGLSPLHIAIKQRASIETIQIIFDRGCRISAVDSEGRTALRLAMDLNAFDEAKMLSDAGSDLFALAMDGKTPATAALDRGEKAVRTLFSGDAIHARDGMGNTVLHYAAQTGRTDLIAVLLELGANKNIRNIAAESPADIALRWNHEQAAAMLR